MNDRFTRVFPVLFGGGEAKLELHEDPEKGEMGIEIIAKPPGKKMQNVTLMSGGEKSPDSCGTCVLDLPSKTISMVFTG